MRLPPLSSHQPHRLADIGTVAGEILQQEQEKEKHPVGNAERAKPAVVN